MVIEELEKIIEILKKNNVKRATIEGFGTLEFGQERKMPQTNKTAQDVLSEFGDRNLKEAIYKAYGVKS